MEYLTGSEQFQTKHAAKHFLSLREEKILLTTSQGTLNQPLKQLIQMKIPRGRGEF